MRPFSEFPDMPSIDPVAKNTWVLEKDYVGPLIKGNRTTVDEGFVTDGASIPRIAVILVGGKMQVPLIGPAVLHDAEYAAELYKRSVCDWRFLIAMQLVGITWFKRNAIYSAVRVAGWAVWARHTLESVTDVRKIVSFVTTLGTD